MTTLDSPLVGIAQDGTLLGRSHQFEIFDQDCGLGVVQQRMPEADMVLFDDDFTDGKMHGWRPYTMADTATPPISVETDYPFPGLFLATSGTPYRPNALSRISQCFKGLSQRFHGTGIVSLAGFYATQSGGPQGDAFSLWGTTWDFQNWLQTHRVSPTLYVAGSGLPTQQPQLSIIRADGSTRVVTGLTNPFNGSTTQSTIGMVAGENQNKWDVNYLRLSYDLGNFLTAGSGDALTGGYYECNLNGFRFDLRDQPSAGAADWQSPQVGNNIVAWNGGMNFGVTMSRAVNRGGSIYPARLVAGGLRATFNKEGWLV